MGQELEDKFKGSIPSIITEFCSREAVIRPSTRRGRLIGEIRSYIIAPFLADIRKEADKMFEQYVEALSEEITLRQICMTKYDSDKLELYYDLETPETLGDEFHFMKDLMADLGLDAHFFITKFCNYLE